MKRIVVVLVAVVGSAHADGTIGLQDPASPIAPPPPPPPSRPDPVVSASSMHGVESASRHRGFNFTLALGGGLTVGVGIDGSIGRGPSGSARFAHMAGERWAFTAELANITLLRKAGMDAEIRTDQGNNLLFGLQLHVNRVLWLRAGGGIGGFKIDDGSATGKLLAGPAGVAGGGFDVIRFKRVALGIEMMALGMVNRDGLLTTTAFMLDLSIE